MMTTMKSMFTKTKARRVAMLLLVAVMTLTAQMAWAQTTSFPKTSGGSGTENDPYLITTPAELNTLASDVNSGTNYSNTYFKLGITINYDPSVDNNYTPIGDANHRFAGHFDGGVYAISGIRINQGSTSCQGLFGYVDAGGSVMNVTLDDAIINGGDKTGGIAGMNLGTITNCHVTSSVTIGATEERIWLHGGIVGGNEYDDTTSPVTYGVVSQCTCSATISGSSDSEDFGGIAGENYGIMTNNLVLGATLPTSGVSHVGNIVGYGYSCSDMRNNFYNNCNISKGVGLFYRTSSNYYTNRDANYNGEYNAVIVYTLGHDENTTITGNSISYNGTDYCAGGKLVTLGYSGPLLDKEVAIYTAKNASDNDITATAISEDEGVYKLTMPYGNATVNATSGFAYIDADGDTKYCTDYTIITPSKTSYGGINSEVWCVVNGTVNMTELGFYGPAHVILCDGASLTTSTGYGQITANQDLTIYGQSGGTGSITVNSTYEGDEQLNDYGIKARNFTLCGGNITVTSDGGGILALSSFTVHRGSINATGQHIENNLLPEYNGAGICSESITINGGQVSATGSQRGLSADGITLGYTNTTDYITASTFNAKGSVSVKTDQTLSDGTTTYTGTIADPSVLAGKTLIPAPGGTCGASGDEDGVTWVYDVSTKTLTISGTGAMADIAYDAEQPWEIVKTEMTSVVIGNGVTNIGNNAFKGCTSLETVSIGSGVASKGSYAFDNCTSLTTITVDENNANYSSEDGVLFNKNKTTLLLCPPGKSGTYTIPNTVTSVGDGSFSGCSSLTEVTIQEGVKTIGYSAFGGCSGLTTISIPNSVTTINSGAFSGCTGVATLQLGSGLTSINSGVFNGLTSLTSLTIGNGVTNIDGGAFYGCTGLKDLTIGDGVTSISNSTFNGCTNLETIQFGAGLTTINSGSFNGYTKLKSVTFKNGTTPLTIYSAAFSNCTSLETVTLSANVSEIGTNAFIGCTSLTSVALKGPATIGSDAFPSNAMVIIADGLYLDNGTEVLGCTITDMSKLNGKVLALYAHYVVKTTNSDITVGGHAVAEADFTFDDDGDDAYCFVADEGDELTLDYTGSVSENRIVVYTVRDANRKDITASVLSGSTLTMPAGNVTVRASKAKLSGNCGPKGNERNVKWSYDPATTTLTISGTGEMGDNPWENLKNVITKVVIDDGVTTILDNAFLNHIVLTDVTIGSGVVTIEENAFDGCAALTGVTIPDGVTTINNDVFRDCSSLTSIDIPKSVTEIEGNIFSGCTSLTGIAVDPANMDYKNDDRGALLSKDGKDFIIYPIGNTATSYDIPYGVTTIESTAFEGCTALTALTIPYGVTKINKSAFEGCSSLTSIIIPASVKNIAVDAFLECTGMTDVYCYVTDPSALSWSDRHCDDFKKDKDQTTCHVFDKDAFDAKWATGGSKDICVTFVGDLATIPFNLTELEGVSHLAALAGKTLPVQFSRTYTTGSGANKASTVCLPFDFDKPDTETVGTFYTFGGVSDDTGEYVVTMNEVTDATLTAGTPYMFVPKASGKLTQGNAAFTVPVEGFAGASSATNGSWQFKGTFEKKTWESGQTNLYGFAGKEYYLSNGSQIASDDIGSFRRFDYGTCAAFRCYLLAPESSGARGVSKAGSLPETLKVRLVKTDGTTTAIGTLDTRTGEVEFGDDWYDLNGRRLDVKPTAKGVYINNGKKIVIKN